MVDVFSAFLQPLFEYIIPLVVEELRLSSKIKTDLEALTRTVRMIQEVLTDAEEKQSKDRGLKLWLSDLRDLAYDMNDLMDEVVTEAQRQQLVPLSDLRKKLSLINPKRKMLDHHISDRINELATRLNGIERSRATFGLRVSVNHTEEEIRETTSFKPFLAIGREDDVEKIVKYLVSPDIGRQGDTRIGVKAVIGMGGMGKTTLAQLVYNDERTVSHFDRRLWVHVSQNFNVNRITTAIIESTGCSAKDHRYLESLQKLLHEIISGKTYLLILDDVWNEDPHKWNALRLPLLHGASGSKILVTTRSQGVANVMGTTSPYRLPGLSNECCWNLFCQYALNHRNQLRHSLELNNITKDIIKRFYHLPLVAITLGRRFQKEPDIGKWRSILQNETWDFAGDEEDITHAVSSSYKHLPVHLKPCFAYLGLIPEGYEFEKEPVVHWWMAQNFIQPRGTEHIEDIGRRYFDVLVERSFIQVSNFNYESKKPRYKMQQLIHDFARHISNEECCILEAIPGINPERGEGSKVTAKTRHLTLTYCTLINSNSTPSTPAPSRSTNRSSRQSGFSRRNEFEMIYNAKGLYTLIITGSVPEGMEIPDDLVNHLSRLRTLDLSYSGIKMLPEDIGDLKHLRCLRLCGTDIKKLPKSFCDLYNLQTLDMRNCYMLEELPEDMKNLRKLRHLELHLDDYLMRMANGLRSMPPGIGVLKDLQTLSRFVISNKRHCGLTEVRVLNNLHGELQISNLQLLSNKEEAEANLYMKQHLELLDLRWGSISNSSYFMSAVSMDILDCLRPHTNLKELRIVGYNGTRFPDWVGHDAFANLVNLRIFGCQPCSTLPSLGQLPALKELYIGGMDYVTYIDCTFCGHIHVPFPSLEKLHLENMNGLKAWNGGEACGIFSLRELIIKNCRYLQQLGHYLPSLIMLEIDGCPSLRDLPFFPSLQSVKVKESGVQLWNSLRRLTTLISLTLTKLPPETFRLFNLEVFPSLRRLEITQCNDLISLADSFLPKSLTYFGIKHCPQLCILPEQLQRNKALEDLEIVGCSNLSYLPEELVSLKSLGRFEISDCPSVRSLPSKGLPENLQFLSINNCSKLEERCQPVGGQDWPKISGILSVWINKKEVSSRILPSSSGTATY